MFKKNYRLYWIADRSNVVKTLFLKIYIYFWAGFLLLWVKLPFRSSNFTLKNDFEIIFPALFQFTLAPKVSQILIILFQTGNINTFVLRCVIFIIHFQKKTSFSREKNILVSEKNVFNVAKHEMKTSLLADLGALQSCSYWKITPPLIIGMCL